MPEPRLGETAVVTEDGHLTGASSQLQTHPVYRTDAYEVPFRVEVPVDKYLLASELSHGMIPGRIRIVLRSALAQLGIDAFHADATEFAPFEGRFLTGATLLTHLDGERSACVLDAMRKFAQRTDTSLPIGRAALLPERSRLKWAEVQGLINGGGLGVDPAAEVSERGELLLPIAPVEYSFDDEVRQEAILEQMLSGSARGVLKRFRREVRRLPEFLHSRQFLVAGVQLDTPDHHVMLENATRVRGEVSSIIHGEAAGLIGGRTTAAGGDRQLEVWNANGRSEVVADIRVVANVYRPAELEQPGV